MKFMKNYNKFAYIAHIIGGTVTVGATIFEIMYILIQVNNFYFFLLYFNKFIIIFYLERINTISYSSPNEISI